MGGPRSIADLLAEVTKISEMKLDDNSMDMLKYQIRTNPLHGAIQSVLIDHKAKVSVMSRATRQEEETQDEDRLNNMLRAEGIVAPGDTSGPADVRGSDEYNKELTKVQNEFTEEMNSCQKNCAEFSETVRKIVQSQGEFRPISHSAVEVLSATVSNKFQKVAIAVKQRTCEKVTHLRKVFLDARRTRKNFSQQATVILNNYFEQHLTHPYPSEHEKEILARQCNISVAQVCNWFGNKRIRYKKMMKKGQEDGGMKKERSGPYPPQIPFGFPVMPTPYMMPRQPFPLPPAYFFPPPNMPQYHNLLPKSTPCHDGSVSGTPVTSSPE